MQRSGFTFINLIILGIGILFIAACRRPDFIHSLVFFAGIAFIVPGAVNIFTLLISGAKKEKNDKNDKKEKPQQSAWQRFASWTASIAALALGAMMCFSPETFRTPLIYIFALCIGLGGIYHTYMLLRGLRPISFPSWLYLPPVAIIVIAMLMFMLPSLREPQNQTTVAMLTGFSMILFAATSFFESVGIRAYNKHMAQASNSEALTTTHYEEVNTDNDITRD